MNVKAARTLKAVIPTASMADIAFLLIIFFMLTMTFEVDKTRVTLPETIVRMEVPKKAAYISVNEAGQIKVSSGDELSVPVATTDDVLSFAAGVVASNPGKEFVIKADGEVPYGTIDGIIDSLKRARVEVIYLLSSAETQEGA
ncbi:MAG TPA: biopolymer transporter ExbD [Thermoanaerobaculia bacterium]|nr:biopolymer transporter ExbD [Thermoanaerobaculia bacterium]